MAPGATDHHPRLTKWTTAWDPQSQSDFEERLRRARSTSRAQYLYIKGASLAGATLTVAAQLWRRVLGDVARQEGRLDEAEHWYRELIDVNPTLNATTHMVEVSLAVE